MVVGRTDQTPAEGHPAAEGWPMALLLRNIPSKHPHDRDWRSLMGLPPPPSPLRAARQPGCEPHPAQPSGRRGDDYPSIFQINSLPNKAPPLHKVSLPNNVTPSWGSNFGDKITPLFEEK